MALHRRIMDFPARDDPALSFSLSTSSFSLLRALAFSVSLSFSFSFSVSVFSLTLSPFLFRLFLSLSFYLFSRMVLTRNFPRCVSRGSSVNFSLSSSLSLSSQTRHGESPHCSRYFLDSREFSHFTFFS